VIGNTVTTVAPEASRSTARTMTLGLSFYPFPVRSDAHDARGMYSHARGADPFDPLLGQLGRGECAAAFAEALELLVFVRADEVAHDLAVAGDGHRFALHAFGGQGARPRSAWNFGRAIEFRNRETWRGDPLGPG
jgi:hypothetical protein